MEAEKEDIISFIYANLREAPQISHNYIKRDGKLLNHRKAFWEIKKHLDDFLNDRDENRFLVMPGLRGVGKTTILFQLYNYLIQEFGIETERVLYLSADELKAYLGAGILDIVNSLVNEVHRTSLVGLEEKIFIFIDEAHFDPNWSIAGKIIYDKTRKVFMIFTGSSALDLEMNVDAVRRIKKESIFPLNFSEYLPLKYNITPPNKLSKTLLDLILDGPAQYDIALQKEHETRINLLKLKRPPEIEWENYLQFHGFPFGMEQDPHEIYIKIFSIIDRVIEKDLYSIRNFSTETRNTISRIITFLAMQKPGGTSDVKLANRIGVSPTLIRNILDVLEKTQLIFPIKPYASAGKLVRKPWKYYFLTPSLSNAINFKLGKYDPNNRETIGVLAENLAASYFFRIKETLHRPQNIFYSPEKGGVDFLLYNADDEIVPVEVGLGKKSKKQLNNAIRKYRANHGILISNLTEKIEKEDNIIKIPWITFSFL